MSLPDVNVIEMQEVEITEDGKETIDIWDDFGEYKSLKEAKEAAEKLVAEIRNHTCPAVFEIADPNHSIGIVVAQYYGIKDVIDIDMIPPEEWN